MLMAVILYLCRNWKSNAKIKVFIQTHTCYIFNDWMGFNGDILKN